jgi:ABC-2 type transport system ATP-binding protein
VSCFILEPEIIILDEPFANLDPTSRSFLKDILIESCKNGTTSLISSHDLEDISEIAHRMLLMENGLIIKDVPASTFAMQEIRNYFMPSREMRNTSTNNII